MCFLGSFCSGLTDVAEGDVVGHKNISVISYVFVAVGLMATVSIFIYLLQYTRKIIKELERDAKRSLDLAEMTPQEERAHEVMKEEKSGTQQKGEGITVKEHSGKDRYSEL